MSILPEDVMARVEAEFNTRESRAVAIELLTAWRRTPSWTEKGAIGQRHGRSGKTVHKITQDLKEMELFTENEGSIPLYRLELANEAKITIERENGTESIEMGETEEGRRTELPLISPAGYPLEEETEEKPPSPGEADLEGLSALENKVFRIEAQLNGLGKKLDAVVPAIQALSAKTPDNPRHSSPQQTLPVKTPSIEAPSESVEDRLGRLETMAQESGEKDPFADLTREQILELARSQPQELVAMMNPEGAGRTDRVESQAVTLRPVILLLTTYSQMLYNKVVHDGYFDGTLSDFANFTMEQYFTDRGWSLDWNKREPASRRRLG